MILSVIAIILLILSVFFFFSAVFGLYRFRFTINKMHATAVGDTLGLVCAVVGVILLTGFSLTSLKLALIPVFAFLTSPVTTHLIAKTEIKYHGNTNGEYDVEEQVGK